MAKQTFTTGQVLTAAQMTSLQQTAMGGGSATAKTASYTLVAADAGTTVIMNSASATTITVNTSLFSAGDTVFIQNIGAGISTITAGTATVNTSASLALAQYEGGTLYFTSASASLFFKADGAAAASGGMTLIEEKSLSAVSSAQFASIPGTYKQLMMVWSGVRHSTSGSQFGLRFNNSSASDYFAGGFGGMDSTVSFSPDTSDAVSINAGGFDAYIFGNQTNTTLLSQDSTGIILIDNYASTSKVKTASVKISYYVVTGPEQQGFNFNLTFNDTTAITTLDIYRVGGSATLSNATNTSIRLYGIS